MKLFWKSCKPQFQCFVIISLLKGFSLFSQLESPSNKDDLYQVWLNLVSDSREEVKKTEKFVWTDEKMMDNR